VSDDKFPILLAKQSIIQPEDNGDDNRAFDWLVAVPGRQEAPAGNGMARRFVKALEIAAFFDVDRNRLPGGTDLDPQQHLAFFAQAARKGWEDR